ncbi:unnamed protein product [Phytomonas sp. Hart1]|nr:unnamed protein product [Phytomonas sp. Hart1]|eukprot:CCW68135.1 unnamed protein product [Phytomonas sp. isolate Hart1]
MYAKVRRPLWSFFLPATIGSRFRTIGYNSFMLMFLISSAAILNRQSHYRAKLSDEDEKTYDRINRRAYIALPDGRMALVYPIIDTQTTFTRTVLAFLDTVNILP